MRKNRRAIELPALTQTFLARSFFDEQARRTRQSYFFVALGVVWMAILGCLIVAVHESLFRQMAVPHESIRQWCLTGSVLAVGLWALAELVLLTTATRVLPLLVGAHIASGMDERVLANVAQEMPIAAGESAANVHWYILETSAPNAFACGRSVQNGSIVVTRGLLGILNRDELQAVVAHELAHLKNGDAQFIVSALAFAWMVVGASIAACIGLALAVTLLALVVVLVVKIAECDDSGIGALIGVLVSIGLVIYGLIFLATYALCVAIVLGLVAIGVKAASSSISQSREYLADACAAQWTRNPLALASALAKIGGSPRLASSVIDLVSPLWLDHSSAGKGDGFRQRLLSFLLHTHPTIEGRIALLREMAGTVAITEARWLLTIRPTAWHRMKEWGLPSLATFLALAIGAMLVRFLFP